MAATLRKVIEHSRRIVFFGGAGVSTESGIVDFRSGGGLYSQSGGLYRPEEILSRTFFEQHTGEFFDYYRNNLLWPNAKPNPAHASIASLERAGRLSSVVTQNIDGLHQAAGSKRVLELHGSVHRNYCVDCGRKYPFRKVLESAGIPRCDDCGGVVRPDMVLYGEQLDQEVLREAIEEVSRADTLIVGGTSLVVFPAAGLLEVFLGSNLVVINMQETPYDRLATMIIREPIGQALAPSAYEALG